MKLMRNTPRARQVLATWLALYPLLTLTLWALQAPLAQLPLPLRTFVLTAFLVPVMGYALVPGVAGLLDRWLPAVGSDSGGG